MSVDYDPNTYYPQGYYPLADYPVETDNAGGPYIEGLTYNKFMCRCCERRWVWYEFNTRRIFYDGRWLCETCYRYIVEKDHGPQKNVIDPNWSR